MITLPNNCRAGEFSIYPPNWRTVKADVKKTWRISYRFYDDNLKQHKLVVIKSGLNRLKTLPEKRAAIKLFIEDEMDLIKRQGYNRITKTYTVIKEDEITPFTLFIDALNYAFKSLAADMPSLPDIRSSLKYVIIAIKALCYDTITINAVRLRHFILIFEQCSKVNEKWSASRHNHYRTYMFILFKKLVLLGVVETNYLRDMPIEKSLKKIRETLSKEERKELGNYLKKHYYYFWRFVVLYFHSSARLIEMTKLRSGDVKLKMQKFKVTVKKGNQPAEKYRIIKTIALDLWNELLNEAQPNDYLFGVGLKPGPKKIRREQLSRRWKSHVKNKFGITSDLAALRHGNLDEIAEILGIKEAQKAAGHSAQVVTMIYATGEQGRQDEELKKINNPF